MNAFGVLAAAFYVFCVVFIVRKVFTRRGRATIGASAAGTVFDMLNKDQREAVHVIVEKKAEKQDPATKDGKLTRPRG